MSARPPISDARLNAYVDGELPAAEAAALADMVAADAALARRVAALSDLKAGVAGLVPSASPELPLQPARRTQRWLPRAGMVAAGLAVAALLGWALVPSVRMQHDNAAVLPGPDIAVPATVVALHDDWVALAEAGAPGTPSPEAPDWMRALLDANGLQLRHAAKVTWGADASARHHAFVGPNACKLSLFETSARGDDTGLRLSANGALQTATWQSGAYGYVMVARNMNRARFATIAASVHAATETRSLAEGELLAAMAGARQRCIA